MLVYALGFQSRGYRLESLDSMDPIVGSNQHKKIMSL